MQSTKILQNAREGQHKTHHSMGSVKGSYQLSRDDITTIYNDDTLDPFIGLVEKPQYYSMLRFDLDFSSDNVNDTNEFEITAITNNAINVTREYLENNLPTNYRKLRPELLDCCILTKPSYINDKGKRKYGVHGQFPNLFISTPDFIAFETSMKRKIKGFDTISKNGWLIYGQQKTSTSGYYNLDYIDVYKDYTRVKPETYFTSTNYKIYDTQEQRIKFTLPLEHYYKQILSIIPFNREPTDFVVHINEHVQNVEKDYKKHKQEFKEAYTNESDTEDSLQKLPNTEDVKTLVNMLSISRADDRLDWLKVGWCLHNLSEDYLSIWKDFSSKSDKYEEGVCDSLWEKCTRDDIGIGSLYMWAKTDNYEAYKKFIASSKGIDTYVDISLNGSHYDVAKLFMFVYGKDNVRITSDKDLTFYHWKDDTKLWEESSSYKLAKILCESLFPIYKEKYNMIYKLLQECDKNDKNKEVLLTCKFKQAGKIIENIKSTPYQNNVCKQIAGYDFDKDFESKVINKSIYELPIKGGNVIDLKTLEIRERTRLDFWAFELNVSFIDDCNFDKNVLPFFKSITCNSPNLIDYHRRLWGYMMTGSISDRSLHIMWGNGCNGKSSVVNIFKGISSNFAVSLDEDTMMKKSSSGAKPEMMDLLHSRCGILPESDKKESMNSKRVKTITGDDDISARHLFGHIVKFRTQCKPIFPTNFKPEIDIDDKAILDRLKLIPFMGRFDKNKANSDYIKDLQENKLDEFFSWFCTGARDWINGAELIPCEEMNDQMTIYIKENNPVIEFLDETFDIITKEIYDKLEYTQKIDWRYKKADVFTEYNCWRQIAGEKVLKKGEFNSMIDKKLTEVKISSGRFYLCKLKRLEHTGEEENIIDGRPRM